MLRLIRHPVGEGKKVALPLLKSLLQSGGAGFKARADSMISMTSLISENFRDHRSTTQEPLEFVRNRIKNNMQELEKLEQEMMQKVRTILEEALIDPGGG
jgi:hypothetical protein